MGNLRTGRKIHVETFYSRFEVFRRKSYEAHALNVFKRMQSEHALNILCACTVMIVAHAQRALRIQNHEYKALKFKKNIFISSSLVIYPYRLQKIGNENLVLGPLSGDARFVLNTKIYITFLSCLIRHGAEQHHGLLHLET